MFAIDCIKANGTHLGTCIDRFYFGSCCQLKVPSQTYVSIQIKIHNKNYFYFLFIHQDEAAMVEPEIVENSIDQNTIPHFPLAASPTPATSFHLIPSTPQTTTSKLHPSQRPTTSTTQYNKIVRNQTLSHRPETTTVKYIPPTTFSLHTESKFVKFVRSILKTKVFLFIRFYLLQVKPKEAMNSQCLKRYQRQRKTSSYKHSNRCKKKPHSASQRRQLHR